MKNRIFLLLAAVAVFAGCQSSQAAGKRSEKLNLDECVAAVHAWSITLKRDIGSFMGVSQERLPAMFCQRIADGLRSGRISYSDINNLQLDQPTEIWLVIKGKSKAAAAAQAFTPRNPNFRICSGVDGTFQVLASQKCPSSGYGNSEMWKSPKGKSKAAPPTPRMSKFRTCKAFDGTFQVPISQKCPLSGYAHY